MPYQTYIGSALHRYVQGELIDEKAANLVKIIRSVS